MTETIPGKIRSGIKHCPDHPDYPTAWAIQRDRGPSLDHHEHCSSVPGWHPDAGPTFLCDCGAVEKEWLRLRVIMIMENKS